jgi:hypothetical protein
MSARERNDVGELLRLHSCLSYQSLQRSLTVPISLVAVNSLKPQMQVPPAKLIVSSGHSQGVTDPKLRLRGASVWLVHLTAGDNTPNGLVADQ